MHLAKAGAGPLVVLCHGLPECWYSWRRQLAALVEYHIVFANIEYFSEIWAFVWRPQGPAA